MSHRVKKFGGTSVSDLEHIRAVADLLERDWKEGNQVVAVLSAMSGRTDRLVGLARDMCPNADVREMDTLMSTGEVISTSLLAIELNARGVPARALQGWQVGILTDSTHGKARIMEMKTQMLERLLEQRVVPVIAGFQGVNEDGDITTLGRGGSDTTAVAVAVALEADECMIYTDVAGVYTADPRMVKDARKLDYLSFEEMLELSGLGAKVLQIRSVEFASKHGMPLRVLSTFEPQSRGTRIVEQYEDGKNMEAPLISGVVCQRDEAKVTVRAVPDTPGLASKLFAPVGHAGIVVDMIIQNAGRDNTTDVSFTVLREDAEATRDVLQGVVKNLGAEGVEYDARIAKVSVVGAGMRSHPGVAAEMFDALASEGINMQMIATSEIKISVVMDEEVAERAVQLLHDVFQLADAPAKT